VFSFDRMSGRLRDTVASLLIALAALFKPQQLVPLPAKRRPRGL
jgi:hypothetical protein